MYDWNPKMSFLKKKTTAYDHNLFLPKLPSRDALVLFVSYRNNKVTNHAQIRHNYSSMDLPKPEQNHNRTKAMKKKRCVAHISHPIPVAKPFHLPAGFK